MTQETFIKYFPLFLVQKNSLKVYQTKYIHDQRFFERAHDFTDIIDYHIIF